MDQKLPLTDPSFLRDPYPFYERIRDEGDVVWDETSGAWLVVSHRHVAGLLSDRMLTKDPRYAGAEYVDSESTLLRMKSRWLLMRDGEFHRKVRSVMQPVFAKSSLPQLEAFVRRRADELLAAVRPGSAFDIMATIANDLPFAMVCHLLGVEGEDSGLLRHASRAVLRTLEPGMTEERYEDAEASARHLQEVLGALLDSSAPVPTGATILDGVKAAGACGALDREECLATLALMFIAGHETTTEMIGLAVNAVADNVVSLHALRDQIAADPRCLHEFWRYDGSVQHTMRVTHEDRLVGDTLIPAGGRMLFLMGAANRDPQAFDEPARLDFDRSGRTHHGFGGGPHYCLGAALATLEVQSVMEGLAAVSDRIELAADVQWSDSVTFRGPARLDIALR